MPKASTKSARATRGSPRKSTAEQRCRQCPDLPLRSQCPHSTEGRLYLKLQATTKSERAPQRCTKCPDRPLRNQCIHTNAGREYIRQQDIEQTLTTTISTLSQPGSPPLSPTANVPPAPAGFPSTSRLPSNYGHIFSLSASSDLSRPSVGHAPETHEERFIDVALSAAEIPLTTGPTVLPPQIDGVIPIDPVLSTPRGVRPTTGPSMLSPTLTPRSDMSTNSTSNTYSDVFTTSVESSAQSSRFLLPSLPSVRAKYQRPTKTNPKFGYVKGAMRGSQELDVLRKHDRPEPSKDAVSASKDFLEGMHCVLERAEDVSIKTGCWIFIGAQHPGAVGGTIHYSSPRLRRDAANDTEELVNNFNVLMTSLLRARRSDALEASKKLEEEVQKNMKLQLEVSTL